MKKFISIILSLIITVNTCNITSFADIPYDYTDPQCIDIRRLGIETDFISKDSKVCGCKKCTLDAVTFNKLEDYVDELKKRFEVLTTLDETYLENEIQQHNIGGILQSLSRAIDYKGYKNKNFFIATTNYDRRSGAGAIAQFAKKDRITYDENIYNEDFFNRFNEEKVKPLLARVKNHVINPQHLPGKAKFEDWGTICFALIATMVASIPLLIHAYKEDKQQSKKANELLDLIKLAPDSVQKDYQKRLSRYFGKNVELTVDNLKKLPSKVIDKLLIELKQEVN